MDDFFFLFVSSVFFFSNSHIVWMNSLSIFTYLSSLIHCHRMICNLDLSSSFFFNEHRTARTRTVPTSSESYTISARRGISPWNRRPNSVAASDRTHRVTVPI